MRSVNYQHRKRIINFFPHSVDMKPYISGLVLLTICFILTKTKCEKLNDLAEAKSLLQLTLNSLKKNLEFLNNEKKNVNLDAIIGTRMVDGTLKVLLYHIDHDPESWPLNGATLQDIRELQALADDISDKAITYVAPSDPVYYRRLGLLLHKDFWTLDFASKDFFPEDFYSAWIPKKGEAMREEDSDNCITELLGTGPNTQAKCHISSECWEKMTKMGYNSYSLTHEVFYLMIGYQTGCQEEMNKQRTLLNQPPPADLAKTYCASIYLEALQIEKNKFPSLRRDLFMEQAALCGALGYRWFFTPEWLKTIISWQDKQSGCYKGDTILESQVEIRPQFKKSTSLRIKREERILDNGCLSHTTAVAAGALAMYVRYIAEYQQMVFERDQIFPA